LQGKIIQQGMGVSRVKRFFVFPLGKPFFMKFIIKRKNGIFSLFSGMILVFFAFSQIVLASEISKESIINLVNKSRIEKSVPSLAENQNLDNAAKDKLEDMIRNNYFAHTSPTGITPWFWFEKNGYDYKYAGENLALGFSSVEKEHQAWMDSPTHRKNILNPNYREIGVAVGEGIIDDSLVKIAVQSFGSQDENSIGIKEESNISDEKSKQLLEENTKENKGIVLNTEDSNNNFPKGGESKVGINFSKLEKLMPNNGGFSFGSMWIISFLVLSTCVFFNFLVAMIIVFHQLIENLRKKQDIFKVVHGLLIMLLVGSIIF
jgi:hypothetical protein